MTRTATRCVHAVTSVAVVIAAAAATPAQASDQLRLQPRAQAKAPKTVTPKSDSAKSVGCEWTTSKLKALATKIYAETTDVDVLLGRLDAAVGLPIQTSPLDRAALVGHTDSLLVVVLFPYDNFRTNLADALRKRDGIESVQSLEAVSVAVSPTRIDAPDIEKIIVERDGRVIPPVANALRPVPLTTALGVRKTLHAGNVLYPCSAFAPGATVTVTAIPDFGTNFVREITSDELTRLK